MATKKAVKTHSIHQSTKTIINLKPLVLIGPCVSMAIGTNSYRFARSIYLDSLRAAAESAELPARTAVLLPFLFYYYFIIILLLL